MFKTGDLRFNFGVVCLSGFIFVTLRGFGTFQAASRYVYFNGRKSFNCSVDGWFGCIKWGDFPFQLMEI